jgi:hypothetical protein
LKLLGYYSHHVGTHDCICRGGEFCVALSVTSLVQRESRRTAAEEDDDASTSGSYMAVENIEDEAPVAGLMQDIE